MCICQFQSPCLSWFCFCAFKTYLFTYWLCWVFTTVSAFLQVRRGGLLSSCGVLASHCSGFSCCWAQALGCAGVSSCGSQLWNTASVVEVQPRCFIALWHVGSSQTRNLTHVSCIGRWILYHWVTRKVLFLHSEFCSIGLQDCFPLLSYCFDYDSFVI